MDIRKQIVARLAQQADVTPPQDAVDDETAMRPYKPKTPAQLRLKTDPAHRMMRDAYKRRTGTDKTKQQRYSKMYRRKNAAQIRQRSKRSRMLHEHHASLQCYEYRWADDGLEYSIVVSGLPTATTLRLEQLEEQYGGEIIDTYAVTQEEHARIREHLPTAKTYENSEHDQRHAFYVYAGRASTACKERTSGAGV